VVQEPLKNPSLFCQFLDSKAFEPNIQGPGCILLKATHPWELCGIGFTMSLFIADLSLTNPVLKEQSKLAILFASLLSGILGLLVLRMNRDRLTDG
jgi:hypothetical protein